MFRIGQEIVCVESFTVRDNPNMNAILPRKYQTFHFDGNESDGFIFLKEETRCSFFGLRFSYLSAKFRPLDEVLSKISIEELTHQLVEK